MQLPKLCVVIVTYNGIQWIEKCLNSIQKATVDADILVVDNGSTDGTIEFLASYPGLAFFHKSVENLGFGKANNLALRYGYEQGYEYFFLLNQDAWIEEDVFQELIACFNIKKNLGIVSPLHFNGQGEGFDKLFEAYLSRTPDFPESTRLENNNRIYNTPFVNAAAWMMNRNTLEKVGVFHPLFNHYGEDDNYIDRLHHQKLEIGIATRVKIFHDRDTEGVNSEKDDPRALFFRTLLQYLLNPADSSSFLEAYKESRKLSKKLSRKIPLLRRPIFQLYCMSEFLKINREVVDFKRNRQSELFVT